LVQALIKQAAETAGAAEEEDEKVLVPVKVIQLTPEDIRAAQQRITPEQRRQMQSTLSILPWIIFCLTFYPQKPCKTDEL
jgi:hypothetical protein